MSGKKPLEQQPEVPKPGSDAKDSASRFSADVVSALTDGVLKPSQARRLQKSHGEPLEIMANENGGFSASYEDGTKVQWKGEKVTVTEPDKDTGKATVTEHERQADKQTVIKNSTDAKGRLTQSVLDENDHETVVNKPRN